MSAANRDALARRCAADCTLAIDANDRRKKTPSTSSNDVLDESVRRAIVEKHGQSLATSQPCNPSLKIKAVDTTSNVRYREGQIVSTKGGRFVEEKRELTEEMKKTYINLKPARKYRFH